MLNRKYGRPCNVYLSYFYLTERAILLALPTDMLLLLSYLATFGLMVISDGGSRISLASAHLM